MRLEDLDQHAAGSHRRSFRIVWALAVPVAALTLLGLSIVIGGVLTPSAALPSFDGSGSAPSPSTGEPPVASCDARKWPTMVVTCVEAQRSVSGLGGSGGPAQVWLTTLAAVDAAFAPARQVVDHPSDPTTPAWVFIYGANPGDRALHVADATDPRTREGGFIYLYRWSELDWPELPTVMPTAPSPTAPSPSPTTSCIPTLPTGGTVPGETTANPQLYSNGQLSTILQPTGEILADNRMIEADGSIGWKFAWWRAPGVGAAGDLRITGHELTTGATITASIAEGYGQRFQASGISFPTEGCYEITAVSGEAQLTFVTKVTKILK
jgi:hypothetical protein